MQITFVKTPKAVKKLFKNYVWDIPSKDKTIYLTFDDGPTPEITNWTLDILKQYNAKATFFCIGNNIEKHPEIFQNIVNEGHAIGNHTHNHLKGWRVSTKNYIENIVKAQQSIDTQIPKSEIQNLEFENLKSEIVNLFRPPHGKITPKQGRKLIELNYKIIMWDILSYDWDNSVSKEDCLNNVISKTENGSIIVFHDSIKASKNMQYTLPKVLEYFSKKGYVFKEISKYTLQ